MDDLISRQAAIDAIEAEKIAHGQYLTSSYVGYEFAEDAIRKLPPAQPEQLGMNLAEVGTNCSEFPNNSDAISRQAAIDHWRLIIDATNTDGRYNMGFVDGLEFCISHLSTMPSAQPEIIRCKDCKHWDGVDTCDVINAPVWDNDFCSNAERRSDEE